MAKIEYAVKRKDICAMYNCPHKVYILLDRAEFDKHRCHDGKGMVFKNVDTVHAKLRVLLGSDLTMLKKLGGA